MQPIMKAKGWQQQCFEGTHFNDVACGSFRLSGPRFRAAVFPKADIGHAHGARLETGRPGKRPLITRRATDRRALGTTASEHDAVLSRAARNFR